MSCNCAFGYFKKVWGSRSWEKSIVVFASLVWDFGQHKMYNSDNIKHLYQVNSESKCIYIMYEGLGCKCINHSIPIGLFWGVETHYSTPIRSRIFALLSWTNLTCEMFLFSRIFFLTIIIKSCILKYLYVLRMLKKTKSHHSGSVCRQFPPLTSNNPNFHRSLSITLNNP